jgi:hypothetical protein
LLAEKIQASSSYHWPLKRHKNESINISLCWTKTKLTGYSVFIKACKERKRNLDAENEALTLAKFTNSEPKQKRHTIEEVQSKKKKK